MLEINARHNKTQCAGASANKYYLGGYVPSAVVAGQGDLNLTSIEAAHTADGTLQALFTMLMPNTNGTSTSISQAIM